MDHADLMEIYEPLAWQKSALLSAHQALLAQTKERPPANAAEEFDVVNLRVYLEREIAALTDEAKGAALAVEFLNRREVAPNPPAETAKSSPAEEDSAA